ncbi:sensor histidine kinase [Pontibacter ummariensis]|nr:histidine kinase [Pontibacter ummariensis]
MKELLMFFVFLVATFWTHEKIASYFSTSPVASLSPKARALLEGIVVVLLSAVYSVILILIPQYLFIPTIDFTPRGIRLNLVATAFIALFFYYFVERERWKSKLQEELLRSEQLQKESYKAQFESLKSQIDPHFLFNSLNILGALIYKEPGKAVQFLRQLSKVYRIVLDSNKEQTVPLRTELELVQAYAFLLQTRFGHNLHIQIDVPPEMKDYELPPTALQMLVENAIKHNGYNSEAPLTIKIYAMGQNLIVANNLQPRLEKQSSSKVGLQNIINRYNYLTDKQVEISQTTNEFIVKLPLLKEYKV